MIEKRKYTRSELAEILGKTKSWVSALCSPTKRNLVAENDNPDIIDLNFPKNFNFVVKRLSKIEKPKKEINIEKTKPENEIRESSLAKEEKASETTSPLVDKLSRQFKANVKKGNSVSDYKESLYAMDEAKLKKIQMEAGLKELELKQRMGELVPSGEVIPFVSKLSKTRDELLRTELMSTVRDFIVEYELPPEFLGRFERESIMILNDTNKKATELFEIEVKPVLDGV